jgi:acetyl esterase/lipase
VAGYLGLLESGVPASKVVVSGDSAGGGLALATLVALRDRGYPMPAAATVLSPWSDLSFTGETLVTNRDIDTMVPLDMIKLMAGRYRTDDQQTDPLVSPVYAELSGFPPLQIHVGSDEILLDDSRRVAANAEKAGVPCDLHVWDEMTHVFPTFAPLLPQTHDSWLALAEMGRFAAEHTSS